MTEPNRRVMLGENLGNGLRAYNVKSVEEMREALAAVAMDHSRKSSELKSAQASMLALTAKIEDLRQELRAAGDYLIADRLRDILAGDA